MSRKPFVVCLMDGMGIEDAKSYNIYNSDVMPTLDAFTSRYLFTTLSSSGRSVGLGEEASATRELGYLNIGAGTIVKQSVEIINNKISNNMFFNNQNLKILFDHVNNNGSSIHLITLIGNRYGEDSVAHLRKTVEYCNSIGLKKIYLHLYLGVNNNSLNKSFMKYTAAIHRILNLYPNVKISTIAGKKYLMDSSGITITKELYKVTVGGIGEHWINYNDAVESNYKRNNLEENIVPFIVDKEGLIKNNDGVFFFNYDNDFGSVYTDLLIQPAKYMYTNNTDINIKIVSLFPLKNETTISCFNYENVKSSFYNCLNQNGIKHLLIADKSQIPYINFYLNGCNSNPGTQALSIDLPETGDYDTNLNNKFQYITNKLMEAINSDYYDLILVNYSIFDGNKNRTTENIKNALISLDKCLNEIYKNIVSRDGTLYITSAYGLNEVMYNIKDELVSVDFSKKVPFIIVDNQLPTDSYGLVSGNLCDISTTILNALNISLSDDMDGKNLLVYKNTKKGKKKTNKMVLILLVAIILLIFFLFALYYFGLI